MTDIVERLRLLESGARWVCNETADTLENAADEIERLRAEAERMREALAYWLHDWLHDEHLRDFGEWFESGCKIARAALAAKGRMLRDPALHSLPAAPGKIICEDHARVHEKSAAAIRALLEDGR